MVVVLVLYTLLPGAGAERDVVICELKSLVRWLTSPHGAQPPVKFELLHRSTACTVFTFRRLSHGTYLAVATTEHVILYKYDGKPLSFSIQKVTYFLYLDSFIILLLSLSVL